MIKPAVSLTLATALIGLAGCATRDANLTVGVDDPCYTVQHLVSEYPEGFPSYRGKVNNNRSIATYRATEDLIDGHCEIWEWGNGDTAYSCSAKASDLDTARDRYFKSVTFLMQCLGPDWSTAEMTRDRDGETNGQATRFISGNHPDFAVSTRLIDEKRGPSQQYTNYLYLGTASKDPGAEN